MTNLRTVSKHPEQLETTPLVAESHHYDDPLEPQKLVIPCPPHQYSHIFYRRGCRFGNVVVQFRL